jgi:hypothetical protein
MALIVSILAPFAEPTIILALFVVAKSYQPSTKWSEFGPMQEGKRPTAMTALVRSTRYPAYKAMT